MGQVLHGSATTTETVRRAIKLVKSVEFQACFIGNAPHGGVEMDVEIWHPTSVVCAAMR
jgi:hypothetical protein